MTKEEWVEKEVAKIEREVYGGNMPVENKAMARQMKRKEYDYWEREQADEIYGFDAEGEGLTYKAND